jgi:adenine-specific DNA-methyltransferase
VIKYLGSKRRLVPVLAELAARTGGRRALDLFTGTTRVAQAFKASGMEVTALDITRCAAVLAQCYIAVDRESVDHAVLQEALDQLSAEPPEPGYVTETFCRTARFFRPENGARIDAVRAAIARDHAGSALEPVLLTSLVEAADRVDSTTGVQMAFVKQWSDRSFRPLELRMPELLSGAGHAVQGDACVMAGGLGEFDLAYLDPPYNQHRYEANYHIWETLVAWDMPPHYGVACKRTEVRDGPRSAFNSRRTMPAALARVVSDVQARLLVLSYNDESWMTLDELVELCAVRGHVEVLAFASARYVGARIGIYNPSGQRVGAVGRLSNLEYLLVAGERRDVRHAVAPWRDAAVKAFPPAPALPTGAGR